MACSPVRTVTTTRTLVFSKGGAAETPSDIFVMSPPDIVEIAPCLKQLRVTIIVENATDSCATKAVFQTTEDGTTWATAVALEASFSSGNRKTTTSWYSTQSDFKRGIRVGVLVQQVAGAASQVHMAYVTMVIDFELKS